MARLVTIDGVEIDPKLRNYLMGALRVCDECLVFPQASRSLESGAVKNCVIHLGANDPEPNPEIFSSNWFGGVALLKVPRDRAEFILSNSAKRSDVLQRLVDEVPSEMANTNVQVGPNLLGDAQERDTEKWTAGFDGPGCCVGLYSALQNKPPDVHETGMSRCHKDYYIVCKAGAGVAGQTFHARLTASLKEGATLESALSENGNPGAAALRRVESASKRNRARILLQASEALGFLGVSTIGDSASPHTDPQRVAIPDIDCSFNTLIRDDSNTARPLWRYAAGSCDSCFSRGMVTSSNVAEGFVAFLDPSGERFCLKNDAHSCLPFSTPRLLNNRDAVFRAVDAYKKARGSRSAAHPDSEWLKARFGWHAKDFGTKVDVEPPSLWGSHCSEAFLAEWGRELGVSKAHVLRLQPEIVAISATEPGKLRVASRAIANV
jgi:hypothetical protein